MLNIIIWIFIIFALYLLISKKFSRPIVVQCDNCHQNYDIDFWKDGVDIMSRSRKCPHCSQISYVFYHKKYK